jgi:hypothetical protein
VEAVVVTNGRMRGGIKWQGPAHFLAYLLTMALEEAKTEKAKTD